MNSITKGIVGVIVIGALAAAIGAIAQKQSTGDKNSGQIKVGAILPLSGDLAALGEEVKRGIELAAEDAKMEGANVAVIYEDDRYTPAMDVSAANKLINVDKVDAAMTMFVEEAKPMAPVFNTSKTPLVALWDSNEFIKSNEYLFSNGFSTERAGEAMAEYAYDKLGMRTAAIIGHIDPWAEIISDAFNKKFEALGGKVVYNERFNVDVTDYKTAIAKIKQANLDGVYFPLMPMNNAKFLMQAKQLGLHKTLLTGDTLIQDVIIETGIAADGVYATNIYSTETTTLVEKYKAKYGQEPMDVTLVSFGYEGLMKIKDAAKAQGNTTEGMVKGLTSIFGEDKSADRIEKIYRVVEGKKIEM
ncbi:MAG: Amino acid/amide ABC transporter substrate-binding protein, HAAT family [Candidatus Wolfebacteria bacterium GW2011_GWB2_46_69]|uniref:Amino acid/amide ABC transporter substrate-binding protein, HAAT family n=2 Tax=Candidatus Wolfeibacteriota TaxID=1752735 RepID=A0A0G1U8I4_9BACT|nr:MAG: amino acid ABC transporter substrate-binding protein, branched-chain amino acid transport system substrate-binding protein [Candidatus Wolfebacteria bacterium GW2011_GWB1_47_1]KKU40958.1 MAG: Amino acid/amide ABC transporter substrate-binding protein, HAAT family [Candidatus Wolfebacteria bacterium GW2011_GWB2_46_69]KKU53143.1 MAG: Amino acid/amide ABC transporter substrate-binding protein, HAAT family [Candidatus Wolfebacteria bacterium GW2011_GWC1_47_103]KKU59728.1 MAG: Amino acid/amid